MSVTFRDTEPEVMSFDGKVFLLAIEEVTSFCEKDDRSPFLFLSRKLISSHFSTNPGIIVVTLFPLFRKQSWISQEIIFSFSEDG
jgi:hypothetical protein